MITEQDTLRHPIRSVLTLDFVLGFLAFFVFCVASFMLIPTMPIYLAKAGSAEKEIGVLIGILSISSLVARLLVGSALRKYSEKRVMIVGYVIFVFTFVGFILSRSFWPLLTVRIFQGISFSCADTATLAFITSFVPLLYRTRAIGYILLAPSFAFTVGPLLGMFLMNRYNFTVVLLAGTALSLCALFFSLKLRSREVIAPKQDATVNKTFMFEWKIVVPAITTFLQYIVWSSVAAFLPLYAIRHGVANPGLFFSAMGFMMLIGRIFGGRLFERYRKETIISALVSASAVALIILAYSSTLPAFISVGMLWGTIGAFIFPACMSYALEYSNSSAGTSLGTYQMFMDSGLGLGPVIMGPIVPLVGYSGMFLSLAFICFANLAYFHLYVRKRATAQTLE